KSLCRIVRDKIPAVLTIGGRKGNGQFASRFAFQIDSDGSLSLVQVFPIIAEAIGSERPAPVVRSAADGIEPDNVRTELYEGLTAQRCGDKGCTFDDSHSL